MNCSRTTSKFWPRWFLYNTFPSYLPTILRHLPLSHDFYCPNLVHPNHETLNPSESLTKTAYLFTSMWNNDVQRQIKESTDKYTIIAEHKRFLSFSLTDGDTRTYIKQRKSLWSSPIDLSPFSRAYKFYYFFVYFLKFSIKNVTWHQNSSNSSTHRRWVLTLV